MILGISASQRYTDTLYCRSAQNVDGGHRNAGKNARNHVQSSGQESCVSKSPQTRRSPSYQSAFVLVVVSVQRNALSAPSTSSICQPIWRPRSPIVIRPTASSFIGCPCHGQARSWGSSVQTELERVQH